MLPWRIAHAGPWQGPVTIREILVESEADGRRAYVIFSNVPDTEGCTGQTVFKRINGNTEKGRHILAMATSALLANKQVLVSLIGCDDWNRPIINGIWIYN